MPSISATSSLPVPTSSSSATIIHKCSRSTFKLPFIHFHQRGSNFNLFPVRRLFATHTSKRTNLLTSTTSRTSAGAPSFYHQFNSLSTNNNYLLRHQHHRFYHVHPFISLYHLPTMRITTNIQHRGMSTASKKRSTITATSSPLAKRIASFAATAFVATTTISVSYAAYYYATAILLAGSVSGVSGENVDTTPNSLENGADEGAGGNALLDKGSIKKDEQYGYEYIGYDTFPGLDSLEDSKRANGSPSSLAIVTDAMSAAGLDYKTETFINFSNDQSGEGENHGKFMTITPKHHHRSIHSACPSYGCPFFPLDVHYEEIAKEQLGSIRKLSEGGTSEEEDSTKSGGMEEKDGYILNSSGSENAATLTLIGYKGGRLEDQINQDRALVLSPYLYWNIDSSKMDNKLKEEKQQPVARLLGAFDGHAKFGEKVSEYVVRTLPPLLGSKLVNYEATKSISSDAYDESAVESRDRDIAKILHDTFLELDASAPADPSGGCTASVVLQLDSKVYIANAGDSRSFVCVHVDHPAAKDGGEKKEATTSILFATREDKPHLGEEQQRVEKMGGSVYLPPGFLATGKGTTRVMYRDPMSGGMSGLAMSRSIGDWDAGKVGVIPDPLVDILDLKKMKSKVLQELNAACTSAAGAVEIDAATGETKDIGDNSYCPEYTEESVKIFAFAATDGLLDYLQEDIIAQHVAKGLYGTVSDDEDSTGSMHPLTSCEDLIYAAAQGWQESKGGRYRDDIAIAVADLEIS